MKAKLQRPIRYDSKLHRSGDFSCGVEQLDAWLRRKAGQGQRRDATRTFVVSDSERRIVGYYALVAAQLEHADAIAAVARGLPRHFPIPVALIARLAVDRTHQGEGLGAALLRDALGRIAHASTQVAMRAVVVHALDERAAGFYAHFGFRPLTSAPRTLMVTLGELRAAGIVAPPP